jgi:hypothetical protein
MALEPAQIFIEIRIFIEQTVGQRWRLVIGSLRPSPTAAVTSPKGRGLLLSRFFCPLPPGEGGLLAALSSAAAGRVRGLEVPELMSSSALYLANLNRPWLGSSSG